MVSISRRRILGTLGAATVLRAAARPNVTDRARRIIMEARVDVVVPSADKRIWEKYREDNRRLDALLTR